MTQSPKSAQANSLMLPIVRIHQPILPPRTDPSPESLQSLADSIRQHGLLHPIAVRETSPGTYELIFGARRLRALSLLGHSAIPAIILDATDLESALLSLTENLQRETLHFLDEAIALRHILSTHNFPQKDLATRIGRSQSAIANRLRLLALPDAAQSALRAAALSERHARALLCLRTEIQQLEAIALCAAQKLSVRQLEALCAKWRATVPPNAPRYHIRDARILINTVLASVHQLRNVGIPATGKVVDHADRVEILIAWKKFPTPACAKPPESV